MSDFYAEIPGDNNSAYNSSDNAYDASSNAYEAFGEMESTQSSSNTQPVQQSTEGSAAQSQESSTNKTQQPTNAGKEQKPTPPKPPQRSKVPQTPRPKIRVVPRRKVLMHKIQKQFDWGSYLLGVLSGIIIYWGYRKLRKPKR